MFGRCLIFALITALWSSSAWAGPCSGKANGLWCSGNDLVTCGGGNVTGTKSCPSGCQSMPNGVPDQCKSASGFCSGKANGAWCNGSDLVQCSNGSQSSTANCPNGCQSNANGVADVCKSAGNTGFCSGKANGAWCDGSKLKQCKDGKENGSQDCPNGCKSMPNGVADQCDTPQQTGFCAGKSDGAWCNGSKLVTCGGGSEKASQDCGNGCKSMPAGVADQCAGVSQPVGDFCSGKADGDWCNGGVLATCGGGKTTKNTACEKGCVAKPPGQPDECTGGGATNFCGGKKDGSYCQGNIYLACGGGKQVSAQSCSKGCVGLGGGNGGAACQVKTDGFCSGKADGGWCDGGLLTQCLAGSVHSATQCPKGCMQNPPGVPDTCAAAAIPPANGGAVGAGDNGGCGGFNGSINLWTGKGIKARNQKEYSDPLGTCPGFTIHSSGCTITSLSMLHAYLGLVREVDGESGDSVVMENKWRTKFKGYDATSYTWGGKQVSGNCLVIWGMTAGGLKPQPKYLNSGKCLPPDAAQFIVTSLNSGMPLVAGVHWNDSPANHFGESKNWHWVLIVGADKDGPIINDPWGGAQEIHLSQGSLGAYTIDTLYSFTVNGQGGEGNVEMTVIDDQGDPVSNDKQPSSFTFLSDDPTSSGSADAGGRDNGLTGADDLTSQPGAKGGGGGAPSSGCAAGPTGGVGAVVFGMLAVVVVLRRRFAPEV